MWTRTVMPKNRPSGNDHANGSRIAAAHGKEKAVYPNRVILAATGGPRNLLNHTSIQIRNPKHETRYTNPKSEARNPKKIRRKKRRKSETDRDAVSIFGFRILDLFRIS